MKQSAAASHQQQWNWVCVWCPKVPLSKAWCASREPVSLHRALHGMLSSPQPRLLICPGGDWEPQRESETQTSVSSSSPHLIFLHPRNLPKAPLQQWRQYFVTESLRLLGTQRHLWESSLSLTHSLSLWLSSSRCLPLNLPLSLSWQHSCYLSEMNTHMLTHTYAHKHSLMHIHHSDPSPNTCTQKIIHPCKFTPI